MAEKQCAECRDGEHPNYDHHVRLTLVRDPDTKHLQRRAYMCAAHRDMYESDGRCHVSVALP